MATGKNILVVEDDEDIQELLLYNLRKGGYGVLQARSGEEGLRMARAEAVDLIVLDLMLPGVAGLEVCGSLRNNAATRDLPIIILTARSEESEIVKGLEKGADDYVTKPFSPRVLLARIKTVLRRKSGESVPPDEDAEIRVHGIVIRPTRHEALIDGKPASLTASEFRILRFLARRPGWVFTRRQIVEAVHGADYPVTERSVDVQIVGLRKKLGRSGDFIETVRGVGYRFRE